MKISSVVLSYIMLSVLWLSVANAQSPQPVGVITAANGQVKITGVETLEQVKQGARAYLGDLIETGDDSGAKILFEDDTLISLGANAEFEITEFAYNPGKRKSLSTLTKGKLKSIVQRIEGESTVEYATPNAVAGVKGTTLLVNAKGIFCVVEGAVSVKGKTREVLLNSGECTRIIDGDPSDPEALSSKLKEEFSDTDFQEGVPLRDSLYEDYPGKDPNTPASDDSPVLRSLPELPLEQPADQLPGVDSEGRAPVDIVIPPSPGGQ
ncbi:MAG: FecR family protein [Deltaproteobacteria bacterium]